MSNHIHRPKQEVRVGERVQVKLGVLRLPARVIELRGPVGYKGRPIVRVETLDALPEARRSFEVPVDDLIRGNRATAQNTLKEQGLSEPA